eukprot:1197546-Rhodomonas_salina.6
MAQTIARAWGLLAPYASSVPGSVAARSKIRRVGTGRQVCSNIPHVTCSTIRYVSTGQRVCWYRTVSTLVAVYTASVPGSAYSGHSR